MTALSVDDGELDLGALEFENMENVTLGVDSGAAVTVVSPDVASDYPRSQAGGKKKMTDCQGNLVQDLGEKDLAFDGGKGHSALFARVTVAPVAKNLLAVSALVKQGHEVVFRPEGQGGSYIRHMQTGVKRTLAAKNGIYETTFRLHGFSGRPVAPSRGQASS